MKVIFSGSSNSCSYNNNNEYLWNTWKHIVIKNYQLENYTDLTYYGQGNEAICTRALLEMHKEVNCILFLQVTPVDKWDWLLPNNMIEKLKNEKHKPVDIMQEDKYQYWSTGNHFPETKKYYQDTYATLDSFVLNTIKHLSLVVSYCKTKGIPFLIVPDSPIFSMTEKELLESENRVPHFAPDRLITDLTRTFYDQIKEYVEPKGIIGHDNPSSPSLWHKKFKHVGPKNHYDYFIEYIKPFADQYFAFEDKVADEIEIEQQAYIKTKSDD
jgi:hypothetical protein